MSRFDDQVCIITGGGGEIAPALAAVLKAPVAFVCENNLYFQTVPGSVGMAIEDIADRAQGYGMPGVIVDGQDVLAVYDAAQDAVARARSGEGATLVECKTFRFLAHYPTVLKEDPDPDEIARWKKWDPITLLKGKAREIGYMEDEDALAITQAILRELEESIVKAEATPPAGADVAVSNVYSEPVEEVGP